MQPAACACFFCQLRLPDDHDPAETNTLAPPASTSENSIYGAPTVLFRLLHVFNAVCPRWAYWRELRWIHIGAMFSVPRELRRGCAVDGGTSHPSENRGTIAYCTYLLHLPLMELLPLRRRLIGISLFLFLSSDRSSTAGLLRIALTLVIAHLFMEFLLKSPLPATWPTRIDTEGIPPTSRVGFDRTKSLDVSDWSPLDPVSMEPCCSS